MKVFIATLGCPKNTVDSEAMAGLLHAAGHRLVEEPQSAQVIVVNTCGFIEPARLESLEALRELVATKRKGQYMVAAGCLAQYWGARLRENVPGIDALLGTRRIGEVVALVRSLAAREYRGAPLELLGDPVDSRDLSVSRHAGPSAYLKIADGCSAPCAFCTIPMIKGPARSRPTDVILREARQLVEAGARELILVAQDTTAYGRDLGQKDALPDLIEAILGRVPDLDWLRIMYAYPQQVTPRMIAVMAGQPQVCHYLDIPLQHGHPDVLKRMRRPHDLPRVIRQIEALRAAMPDIALRTTLIVGFPGETDQEFQALHGFVQEMAFDRLGAFPFSPEAGTPAAVMPGQIPDELKQERYDRVMSLQRNISTQLQQKQVGRILDVLVEGHGDGISVGRSYRDAPEIDGLVIVEGERPIGTLSPARITSAGDYDLWGTWVAS